MPRQQTLPGLSSFVKQMPPQRKRSAAPLNTVELIRAMKPRWRRRLPVLWRTLGVLGVLGLLWLQSGHFRELLRVNLEEQLSALLGEGVALAELELSWAGLGLSWG